MMADDVQRSWPPAPALVENPAPSLSADEFAGMGDRARNSRILAIVLTFIMDVVVIGGVAIILPVLDLNEANPDSMIRLLGFVLVVYVGIAIAMGAYDPESFRGRRLYMGRASKALLLGFVLTFAVFFSLKVGTDFSRLLVSLLGVVTIPGIALGRLMLFRTVGKILRTHMPAEILIVDGVVPVAADGLIVIDAKTQGLSSDLSDYENVRRVAALGRYAERIVVQCPPEKRHAWSEMLKCLAVRSEIYFPELDSVRPLALGDLGTKNVVVVSEHPLLWRQMLAKRLFDLVVSALLLILLGPVLIATAMAIRLESPGPVLFKQKRLGFGQRRFVMLKFRSMRHDRADATASKLTEHNDPRVTRVGAFIRKTSLDELPQLINVLMGDMSLVGPRPHAPAALAGDKLYWEVDGMYWRRHIAKPGITGLAQVRGHRGNTFEETDLQSRLDSDLEYVTSWSLWRDIEILTMTLTVVVHKKAF